jgi:hypothetical protein
MNRASGKGGVVAAFAIPKVFAPVCEWSFHEKLDHFSRRLLVSLA